MPAQGTTGLQARAAAIDKKLKTLLELAGVILRRSLPLPIPCTGPIKSLLTIDSSGCTAFGHPARPSQRRSPTSDGRALGGAFGLRRFASVRRQQAFWADVPVDDNRCRGGTCRARQRGGLSLSLSRSESKIVSRRATAIAPVRDRPRAEGSCQDRAARIDPTAAIWRRRATPIPQPAQARLPAVRFPLTR